MTADEQEKDARIIADVKTYTDEMILKFITGKEPISNFDSFVQQVKSLKIDESLAIRQAAYERYMAR